ncbi:hypothetical protein COV20_04305 [Candidatus Woesearchaeota archaeon CG10_big_fil_rev_8_21_14_0_10_45_16]|nr:MAG: hypothetical protein COV20_04305 [Candidatus Woesearchaeota archaeon CG10_big_fil_rev_8_21_14_0_10_45_16]
MTDFNLARLVKETEGLERRAIDYLLEASDLTPYHQRMILALAAIDEERALLQFYALEQINPKRRTSLERVIGSADGKPLFLGDTLSAPEESVHLTDALPTFSDKKLQEFVERLISRASPTIIDALRGLPADATAEDNVRRLMEALTYDGKVVIPRKIVSITPLESGFDIQFSTKYAPDPLTFFHEKYPNGVDSRYRLRQHDRGLHDALYDAGLISTAIPQRFGHTDEERMTIIGSYYLCQGDVTTAAAAMSLPWRKVWNFWNNNNLRPRTRKHRKKSNAPDIGRIDVGDIQTILDASRRLNLPDSFLSGIWRNQGFKVAKEGHNRDYAENPSAFYTKVYGSWEGLTRRELKKIDPSLHRALLRYGQLDEAIPDFRGYTQYERDWIVVFHKHFEGNAVTAAKGLGKPRRTISKIWSEAGLPNSRIYSKLKAEDRLDEILYFKE